MSRGTFRTIIAPSVTVDILEAWAERNGFVSISQGLSALVYLTIATQNDKKRLGVHDLEATLTPAGAGKA